jgi:PAS domain S-box-containing protein
MVFDGQGSCLETNNTGISIMGYKGCDLIGKKLNEFFPKEFSLIVGGAIRNVMAGQRSSFEAVQKFQDSSEIIWDAVLSPIRDKTGKVTRFIGIFSDITKRKLAEQSLRQSEEFLRNVLDNVDLGFLVIDRDYRIIGANKAFCKWADAPIEDITNKYCYKVTHKSLRPCFEEGEDCAVKRTFQTGEPHKAVHKHEDAKGNILYVETSAFPLKDASGTITSAIETINNITDRYLLEAEQLKTQKLEAIGTLAGGIAHDFNNLLQGVFGYLSIAKMSLNDREKTFAMLEQAEQALNMSVNLTSQLLTFSKGGKPVKKRIKLRSLIENTVKFAMSGSPCDYRFAIDEKLSQVEADEGQIGQVIQNIVLNANDAMPYGGTVTVHAKNAEIPKAHNSLLVKGGKFVNIRIKDSGVGIPEQYLPRVFDPYFTTKQKGSGLGLATSYSIVRNHGGVLWVNSKVGKGTTFYIYLPAIDAEEEKQSHVSASIPERKGRVLLMDDEEMIRNVATEMITVFGHEVECAEDGKTAIEKFNHARNAGRPFDVVILDLTVKGGMGGEQTVKKLLEIDPKAKVAVSSGYAENPVTSDYRSYGFAAILNKPYRIDLLRDTLNSLIGS